MIPALSVALYSVPFAFRLLVKNPAPCTPISDRASCAVAVRDRITTLTAKTAAFFMMKGSLPLSAIIAVLVQTTRTQDTQLRLRRLLYAGRTSKFAKLFKFV